MQSTISTRANAVGAFSAIEDMREGEDFSDDEEAQVFEEVKENPIVQKQRSSGSSGNEDFTGEGEGVTQKPM